MYKDLISVREFATRAAISNKTVYRQVRRGEIPAVMVGGQVRIPSWYLSDLSKRPGELPQGLKGGM
jgi:excisionase family DNA binding protein